MAALLPSPRSAAWWASTAVRLEVSSTKVLKAPICVLVWTAASAHSGCPRRCMTYDASSPPKITTSEASTHHTASLPVAIPVAARVVAMGLMGLPPGGQPIPPGPPGAYVRVKRTGEGA